MNATSETISKADALAAIEGQMGDQPYFYKLLLIDLIGAINALPAVSVTDDMVERAAIAFYNDPPGHGRCINDAMRAALEAALPDAP